MSSPLLRLLGAVAIVAFISLLYAICGRIFYRRMIRPGMAVSYEWGAGYFLGLSVHLALWRALAFILNASFGLWAALLMLTAAAYFFADKTDLRSFVARTLSAAASHKKLL